MPDKESLKGGSDDDGGHHHGPAAGGAQDDARFALELCDALLQPENRNEMRSLLADICTPGEIRSLAERWRVARLLDDGALSYREIAEATGVSTTTITRVARFLRDEPYGGYRLALDRLRNR